MIFRGTVMAMAETSDLTLRRFRLVLEQMRAEQAREHGWQTRVAKLLGVDQSTVNKAYAEQRGVGRHLLERMYKFGISPSFFVDPSLGDEPRFRDHMETRIERDGPHDEAIFAFAAERDAEGRPLPAAVVERLRRDLYKWDGKVTRDNLLQLLPIAMDRVERMGPPPVPEGLRRVSPGRKR